MDSFSGPQPHTALPEPASDQTDPIYNTFRKRFTEFNHDWNKSGSNNPEGDEFDFDKKYDHQIRYAHYYFEAIGVNGRTSDRLNSCRVPHSMNKTHLSIVLRGEQSRAK